VLTGPRGLALPGAAAVVDDGSPLAERVEDDIAAATARANSGSLANTVATSSARGATTDAAGAAGAGEPTSEDFDGRSHATTRTHVRAMASQRLLEIGMAPW